MRFMQALSDHLQAQLRSLMPKAQGYWVAYSGGLDSHVLLHAMAELADRLPVTVGAVHVNHNLQSESAAWEGHCGRVCAELGVSLQVLNIAVQVSVGQSPEDAARQARYQALASWLPPGHAILLAHHQEDQAETVLLQLLRGAGPRGMAAMPALSVLGQGQLIRPLLDCARSRLRAYAEDHALQWVEDPSNVSQAYDRNFVRHRLWPPLEHRWPSAAKVLSRAAELQAETAQLLDELAAVDLPRCVGQRSDLLSIRALRALSRARCANVLRYWLRGQAAPLPSRAVLERIMEDVLPAAGDAVPRVEWAQVSVRRYRDDLYLLPAMTPPQPDQRWVWDMQQPLDMADGVLSIATGTGQGVAAAKLSGRRVQVRLRQGGERLQPQGRREHQSLKHLFQSAAVPPWERARVPLIYLDENLIAVAGYWVTEGFQAAPETAGIRFLWSRAIVSAGSIW